MSDIAIKTMMESLKRAKTTNATGSSFPSRIPQKAKPTIGDGVFELTGPNGGMGPNGIVVLPYLLGADNVTGSVRLIGWRLIGGDNPDTQLWIPMTLAEYDVVGGGSVGIAGCVVLNTERFADTLTKISGGDLTTPCSPADDTIGSFSSDVLGNVIGELTFKKGTATSMNALYSLV